MTATDRLLHREAWAIPRVIEYLVLDFALAFYADASKSYRHGL
jgi:hypothetical protein